MYKVQYMNYKTKEIAEEEFKHPKYALSRYLTIDESMKQISGCEIHTEEIMKHVGEHEVKGNNGDTDLVKSIYSEVEYLYNELFMSQVDELMSNFDI